MIAADIGTGATIVFGTSAFSAQLTSIALADMSRESVETTHLGTTAASAGKIGSKTFIPGDLADPGKITIEGHFDADTIPPVEGVSETITITFPKGSSETSASTWAFTGFVTSFSFNVPLENLCTFTMEIKISGNITRTSAT